MFEPLLLSTIRISHGTKTSQHIQQVIPTTGIACHFTQSHGKERAHSSRIRNDSINPSRQQRPSHKQVRARTARAAVELDTLGWQAPSHQPGPKQRIGNGNFREDRAHGCAVVHPSTSETEQLQKAMLVSIGPETGSTSVQRKKKKLHMHHPNFQGPDDTA
jgi:hypothetical protein